MAYREKRGSLIASIFPEITVELRLKNTNGILQFKNNK